MIKRTIRRKERLVIPLLTLLLPMVASAAPLSGYQSYNGVTNDVGPDLATVIEYDVTKPACDQYQADLDQYLSDNGTTLSQLDSTAASLGVLSERDEYIIDNFVDDYDRDTLLQCGKYLYFYGHFDTTGAPQEMFNWVLRYFDDYFGDGMTNFGMYADPNPIATIPAPVADPTVGSRQLPVGIAASSGDFGTADNLEDAVKVYSFTCSACHFKQMDDGNFAVGIGNTEYDYARMNTAQAQLNSSILGNAGTGVEAIHQDLLQPMADARAKYGQIVDDEFLEVIFGILDGTQEGDLDSIGQTPLEMERNWNTWTGVIDFLVRPMQDDGVHNLTRIMNTNAIETDEHVLRQHGFKQQQGLSWNGGAYNLIQFIRGFITITPSDPVTPESREEYNYWVNEYRYMPLVRYLETLQEPELPTDRSFDQLAAKRGEALFDQNCTSCHNGPGGETSRPYDHIEVRVEDTHADIMAPFWDDTAFDGAGGWENGIPLIAERFPAGITGEITRQVKAPRFISMWDNNRLLHNGSVGGLDELFTCEGGRTSYATMDVVEHEMFSNAGHEFGCHLLDDEKADLKTFIETYSNNRNVLNKYNGQFDNACQTLNNGKSQIVNLTFTEGRRMELKLKQYSDANCEVFDTDKVNNPSVALAWGMELDSTFTNSRGFESHKVLYTKPDGTTEYGVIALENGELANNTEGDPERRAMHAMQRVDYAGLNGVWLNNECEIGNTKSMVVMQDGYRVDKLVTYSAPLCTGDIASVVNTGAWTFDDPKWLRAGIVGDATPKYNMRLRMKAVDGSGWTTQFVNRWGDNFSTMFNNYFVARINNNGEHYTRINNVMNAQ